MRRAKQQDRFVQEAKLGKNTPWDRSVGLTILAHPIDTLNGLIVGRASSEPSGGHGEAKGVEEDEDCPVFRARTRSTKEGNAIAWAVRGSGG